MFLRFVVSKTLFQVAAHVHRYRLWGGERRCLVGEEGLDGENGVTPHRYIVQLLSSTV